MHKALLTLLILSKSVLHVLQPSQVVAVDKAFILQGVSIEHDSVYFCFRLFCSARISSMPASALSALSP